MNLTLELDRCILLYYCRLRSSLFSILFYAHFIRMRYYTSSAMRDAFHGVTKQMDYHLLPPTAHPKVPPVVSKYYQTFRDVTKAKHEHQKHHD